LSLKNRVVKIEQKLGKPGEAPVEIVCIYSGDPEAEQKKQKAIEAYHRKYGSLENLTIVRTHCPEPLLLPERLIKN
jgi:hypothetical protein